MKRLIFICAFVLVVSYWIIPSIAKTAKTVGNVKTNTDKTIEEIFAK